MALWGAGHWSQLQHLELHGAEVRVRGGMCLCWARCVLLPPVV
jgi:hypothetical protein